jgi:hypothetical protein
MKAIVTMLVAICSLRAVAQQPWQKIQMPTAAEVAQTWKTPPPEPYYGLNGAVDETVIRRDLDRMKALGYQAVTVQAEIWDPQTGKITAAEATGAKGAVKIQLELKPYAATVVVVR